MSKFLISIAALAACADFGRVAQMPGVNVYKYVDSKQCNGGGTPLTTMMHQLSGREILVINIESI